jgi:hypothetical protein
MFTVSKATMPETSQGLTPYQWFLELNLALGGLLVMGLECYFGRIPLFKVQSLWVLGATLLYIVWAVVANSLFSVNGVAYWPLPLMAFSEPSGPMRFVFMLFGPFALFFAVWALHQWRDKSRVSLKVRR